MRACSAATISLPTGWTHATYRPWMTTIVATSATRFTKNSFGYETVRLERGAGAAAVTMMGSLWAQISIGNETSKSARTCSDGTNRCGEDLSAALAAGLGLPAAAFSAASAPSLTLGSSSLFGVADSVAAGLGAAGGGVA